MGYFEIPRDGTQHVGKSLAETIRTPRKMFFELSIDTVVLLEYRFHIFTGIKTPIINAKPTQLFQFSEIWSIVLVVFLTARDNFVVVVHRDVLRFFESIVHLFEIV